MTLIFIWKKNNKIEKGGNCLFNCTCKIHTTCKYIEHVTQMVFQTVRKRRLYKYVVLEQLVIYSVGNEVEFQFWGNTKIILDELKA